MLSSPRQLARPLAYVRACVRFAWSPHRLAARIARGAADDGEGPDHGSPRRQHKEDPPGARDRDEPEEPADGSRCYDTWHPNRWQFLRQASRRLSPPGTTRTMAMRSRMPCQLVPHLAPVTFPPITPSSLTPLSAGVCFDALAVFWRGDSLRLNPSGLPRCSDSGPCRGGAF